MVKRSNSNKNEGCNPWCWFCGGRKFCGIFLLIVGLWFLGESLGWFSYDFPFWAVFLIFLGLWVLFRKKNAC